jgi:hypothetical protein
MIPYLNFKTQWNSYLVKIRPDLSKQSIKLYSHQLNKISQDNKLNDFDVFKFITRLSNKGMRNKSLDFIMLDGSNQSKNQRLSAVRNVLEANKESLNKKKFDNLMNLLSTVGDKIRYEISQKAGTNIKTESEENNMKVDWEDLTKFAKEFKPELSSSTGMRDYLILNLILNNYEEIDGIKYNIILRIIEYASLYIWTNKKKPPDNKKNYIYLHNNELYIQHSKTIGGVRRVGTTIVNQKPLATYKLNENIKDFIKLYIKKNKIKNGEPLFYNDNSTNQIDTNYFSKILKSLLNKFGDNMNSTMIRKIYENRVLNVKLNANQQSLINKNADHSLSVANTYYKKI